MTTIENKELKWLSKNLDNLCKIFDNEWIAIFLLLFGGTIG